jgi:hypothetical protein
VERVSRGEAQDRVDVAKQAQTVEWLKAELVSAVAAVLHAARRPREDQVCDALAGVLLLAYLLGRRLGIPPSRLEAQLLERVLVHRSEGHELEAWYGDLTALAAHLDGRRGMR